MSEYANCVECGQGRLKQTMDENGVCVRCKLPKMDLPENPLFSRTPIVLPTMADIHRLERRIEELENLLRTHRHGYRWEPVGNDGMPMCPTPNES
jgi:putative hemolysin